MIKNAGIFTGSAVVLAGLVLASQAHPEPSDMSCTGVSAEIAKALSDPRSGCGHLRTNPPGIKMIDVDVYTGRVPIRPTLDAAKSKAPRRRLSNVGSFGRNVFG
jgi:hypothetical protein